ncbi:MAG: LysM peptidoglycan-binding domain-containing protein [Cytophagales bacterium]|jgi:membrane-bound lytic murein transglycosylase D|nr:LysM peptidoglycan-binding domain-containing protein [Cytophagales bacterium]
MTYSLTRLTRQAAQLCIFCISAFFIAFFAVEAAQAQEPVGPLPIEELVIVPDEEDTVRATLPDTAFTFDDEVIKDRLALIEGGVPLHYNKDIRAFIELFTMRRREYIRRVLTQQSFYFPIFEAELKRNGLPEEIKYLSVVESALNPKAVSRAGAVGLWQFMPGTGKESGLRQDGYVDERMDIYKSTRAACAYLKYLHNLFGDWELAMAGYNCGPGAVRRAIRRAGNRTSFWEIYPFLPRETRSYVPLYVATTYVMAYHKDYMFDIPNPRPFVEADTVHIAQAIDLKALATELDVAVEDIQALNPHLKKGVVPAYLKNYPLHLPKSKALVLREYRTDMMLAASRNQPQAEPVAEAPAFDASVMAASVSKAAEARRKAKEEAHRKEVAALAGRKKVTHTVASGDVLGRIAELYDVGVSELRRWNNLRGSTIKAGQELAVWVQARTAKKLKTDQGNQSVAAAQVPQALPSSAAKKPNGRVYQVQPGDTLWSISRSHGIPVETLRKLNNLKGNELKAGQQLIVG